MAEFTLPANSKISGGDHYPAQDGASNVRTFKIYRWSPDDDANRASTASMLIWMIADRWFWTR